MPRTPLDDANRGTKLISLGIKSGLRGNTRGELIAEAKIWEINMRRFMREFADKADAAQLTQIAQDIRRELRNEFPNLKSEQELLKDPVELLRVESTLDAIKEKYKQPSQHAGLNENDAKVFLEIATRATMYNIARENARPERAGRS